LAVVSELFLPDEQKTKVI